jgi:hypothetical protein
MAQSVAIDMRDIQVVPFFKHVTVEDINASEREGHAVMKVREVVEVRFAGSKLYSPVFPTNAMWKRDGGRTITYAERWADQYRDFLQGADQKAAGTPLEMLKPYGISDAQLSLCRALKIYSIEALHVLEGPNLKSLGMSQNLLKDMARAYMADRSSGVSSLSEIDELKRQIAELRAAASIPAKEATPVEVEAAIATANDEFEALDEAALKAFIKDKTGQAPRGTPSREFLLNAARELAA